VLDLLVHKLEGHRGYTAIKRDGHADQEETQMKPKVLSLCGLCTGALAIAGSPALAATEDTDGNSYTITPYLWGSSIDGTVSPSGAARNLGIDADFGDMLDQTDTGYALAGDARWGRFGILADYGFLGLSERETTLGTTVNYDVDMEIANLAAYYRVDNSPQMDVDLYAGGRWWNVETDLNVRTGTQAGRRKNDNDWTDYFVGARVKYQPGERWFFKGLGDYGSGDSDETWQLYAAGGYEFSDAVSAEVGYRMLQVDYEDNGFLYDVTHDGLLAGVNFKF